MRSDEEIMTLPLPMLTEDEYRRHGELLRELKTDVSAKSAYVQGQVDAHKAQLLRDDSLREDLRVREWLNQPNHGISFDRAKDEFTNVPEGWPEAIDDAGQFVSDWIDQQFASDTNAQQGPDVSPSVSIFRKVIGGEK